MRSMVEGRARLIRTLALVRTRAGFHAETAEGYTPSVLNAAWLKNSERMMKISDVEGLKEEIEDFFREIVVENAQVDEITFDEAPE